MMGPWNITETTEYSEWFVTLSGKQQRSVFERLELLKMHGPGLTRPYADTLKGSRHTNLKELRISSEGTLRILFGLDPERNAVLLLGGDKSERSMWNDWYRVAIKRADDLFEQHINETRRRNK